ncbi:MAG TPA: hypothetical protein VK762_01880 [Polyangiaceae bacterium]|jgi:hypothetical protein|nr:hypothetical protein [Polyangiaceae bacterium]
MTTLHSQLHDLARSFAEQVVEAIRGTSLHELIGAKDGGSEVGNGGRARVVAGGGGQPDPLSTLPKRKGKSGRLPRRSAEEIAKALDKIVLLVKTHKNGLRAEEIRAKLGMLPKEMPRILKEGVAKKKLASKGQKRATTYTAK